MVKSFLVTLIIAIRNKTGFYNSESEARIFRTLGSNFYHKHDIRALENSWENNEEWNSLYTTKCFEAIKHNIKLFRFIKYQTEDIVSQLLDAVTGAQCMILFTMLKDKKLAFLFIIKCPELFEICDQTDELCQLIFNMVFQNFDLLENDYGYETILKILSAMNRNSDRVLLQMIFKIKNWTKTRCQMFLTARTHIEKKTSFRKLLKTGTIVL